MRSAGSSKRLTASSRVTFADLVHLPLVFRERGSKTRQKLQEATKKAGVPLTPVIEAEGREVVRGIVASGAGIGFVSVAEYGHDDRFRLIRLEAPAIKMDEALICLRERSRRKLVAAFMELAAKTAA